MDIFPTKKCNFLSFKLDRIKVSRFYLVITQWFLCPPLSSTLVFSTRIDSAFLFGAEKGGLVNFTKSHLIADLLVVLLLVPITGKWLSLINIKYSRRF